MSPGQEKAAAFGIRLAFLPVSVMSSGTALAILWRWFVVPLGVPEIGLWQASGISALVGLMTMKMGDYAHREDPGVKAAVEGILSRLIFAWLCVLVAWPIWGMMP